MLKSSYCIFNYQPELQRNIAGRHLIPYNHLYPMLSRNYEFHFKHFTNSKLYRPNIKIIEYILNIASSIHVISFFAITLYNTFCAFDLCHIHDIFCWFFDPWIFILYNEFDYTCLTETAMQATKLKSEMLSYGSAHIYKKTPNYAYQSKRFSMNTGDTLEWHFVWCLG